MLTGEGDKLPHIGLAAASLGLGLLHGFDTDHVVAVTNFVSQDPRPRHAARFGLQFGSGHTLTVLIFGIILLLFKYTIPESLSNLMELTSGAILILLGSWVTARHLSPEEGFLTHTHQHAHSNEMHVHEHTHFGDHLHRHGATLTGSITGLAGTAGVMLFGPIIAAPSIPYAAAFIIMYGLGVSLSMNIYGYFISSFYRAASRSKLVGKAVGLATGLISIGLGLMWVLRRGSALGG